MAGCVGCKRYERDDEGAEGSHEDSVRLRSVYCIHTQSRARVLRTQEDTPRPAPTTLLLRFGVMETEQRCRSQRSSGAQSLSLEERQSEEQRRARYAPPPRLQTTRKYMERWPCPAKDLRPTIKHADKLMSTTGQACSARGRNLFSASFVSYQCKGNRTLTPLVSRTRTRSPMMFSMRRLRSAQPPPSSLMTPKVSQCGGGHVPHM